MSWSKDQVALLIDLYKQHPCLYAVKSKEYKNKHARMAALSDIVKKLLVIRKFTNANEVKTKFNGLRTHFLAEYRKYQQSYKSGMGEDEIYKPNLWYFDTMLFILEHTTPRKATDSIPFADSEMEDGGTSNDVDENNCQENTDDDVSVHEMSQVETPQTYQGHYPGTITCSTPNTSKSTKKRKRQEDSDSLSFQNAASAMQEIAKVITASDDAKYVAMQEDPVDAYTNYLNKKLKLITDADILQDTEEEISGVVNKHYRRYLQSLKQSQ